MGVFGFVMSGGGAVGVLLGGVLTGLLSWHWIFLVNVPVGIAVVVAARAVLPTDDVVPGSTKLDVPGAVLVTAALMLAVYAVVGGNEAGWTSTRTLALLAVGGSSCSSRSWSARPRPPSPLVPLRLFSAAQRRRSRRSSACSGPPRCSPGSSWPRSTSSRCSGYSALEVGLAFVPTSLVMMFCSLKVSDRLVMAFGIRAPLTVGLALAAASLALFAMAPVDGSFVTDVLPSMVLLGVGAGIAFNPVLLAAMGDVEPHEAGLASGVVNTSFMMGGALGLAVLVAVSDSRTASLAAGGRRPGRGAARRPPGRLRGRRRRRRPGRRGRRGVPPAAADGDAPSPRRLPTTTTTATAGALRRLSTEVRLARQRLRRRETVGCVS